jgi:hypothetical protein
MIQDYNGRMTLLSEGQKDPNNKSIQYGTKPNSINSFIGGFP